jgi:hypothetical protein
MILWHKLVSLKMSVDLAFLCNVTSKSGSLLVSAHGIGGLPSAAGRSDAEN